MIFGRLVIRTFGIFLIFIDTVVFWLTTRVSPFEFVIAPPAIVWLLLAALFYNLLKFVLSTLVGVNRPHVEGAPASDAVWKQLENLPGIRNSRLAENLRLQQVYDTLGSFGLEIAMERTAFNRLFGARFRTGCMASATRLKPCHNPPRCA